MDVLLSVQDEEGCGEIIDILLKRTRAEDAKIRHATALLMAMYAKETDVSG